MTGRKERGKEKIVSRLLSTIGEKDSFFREIYISLKGEEGEAILFNFARDNNSLGRKIWLVNSIIR